MNTSGFILLLESKRDIIIIFLIQKRDTSRQILLMSLTKSAAAADDGWEGGSRCCCSDFSSFAQRQSGASTHCESISLITKGQHPHVTAPHSCVMCSSGWRKSRKEVGREVTKICIYIYIKKINIITINKKRKGKENLHQDPLVIWLFSL